MRSRPPVMSPFRLPQMTRTALLMALLPMLASAQTASDPPEPPAPSGGPVVSGDLTLPFSFEGPPVPELPDVIARDAEGRATVRAVRVRTPMQIDGRLVEPLYTTVQSIDGFVQIEPIEGAQATERTEMWVAFDDDNFYLSFRLWETEPDRLVANEMRRDSTRIYGANDNVMVMLDTFYDRRNSLLFQVNPIGGRIDAQVTDSRQFSVDWNPVWEVSAGSFEGGWTAEMAIPFKSLRYRPGRAQIWGLNAGRTNRWKNETSLLTPVPAALGPRAVVQAALAATLVGVEAPAAVRNLEIKPFAIADLSSDVPADIDNAVSGDAGFDVNYGLGQSLTANFTYNTDFAQVEADEQQINLTRFSLFFPEKREFFLENQGLFNFGGSGGGNFGGGGGTPILFYSRRIGLDEGREVPVVAGGRLTGRAGRLSIGLLDIQTDDVPALGVSSSNFSAVRLRQDVLRRSSVGLLYTGRSDTGGLAVRSTYGADGAFGFFDTVTVNTYWARTDSPGLPGDDTSYRAQFDYAGDRYGVQAEHLFVGDAFRPALGFVQRDDMRQTSGQLRFSPRPRNAAVVRKYSYAGAVTYIEDAAGRLETRELSGSFGIEFQNSDQFSAAFTDTFEFLPRAFEISPGVVLPVDGYDFASGRVQMTFGQHRPISGRVSAEHGTFFSGHRTTFGVSQGRLNLTSQLSAEPTYSFNRIDLEEGAFTTHLAGSRVTYTMTPRMFTSALIQYASDRNAVSTNVRLRWEYSPGSELFVVYNEQRDTRIGGFPDIVNRAFIVKVNRLFRF